MIGISWSRALSASRCKSVACVLELGGNLPQTYELSSRKVKRVSEYLG